MSPSIVAAVVWSYGLAGVCYLALAARLAVRKESTLQRTAMLWAASWTAAWAFAVMAFAYWQWAPLFPISAAADTLSYAGWYVTLYVIRPRAEGGADQPARASWMLTASAAVTLWSIAVESAWLASVLSPVEAARLVQYDGLAAAVLGLVMVEQVFRNAAHESRWAITHLILGLGAVFAFDVFTYADAVLFNRIDPDVWSARGFIRTIALLLIAFSLARTKGAKFKISLSRQVMFRSAALAFCGMYLLFMAAAGYYVRYFGGEWGRALQVAFLATALLFLLVLLFSGSLRAKLRVTVSKHFFPYRYDYREEWLRFTHALTFPDEHATTGHRVVRGLADLVESPAGALWLRDATGTEFVPAAAWNMRNDHVEPAEGALALFLRDKGWVVNLEEYRSAPQRYGDLRLPSWLSDLPNAWLVVPLAIGRELTGFVLLTTARTAINVDWEVNDLLKTAGRQAASFLGHVQATEALLEARKFEAFNRLSAFVVHDLKNIVSQLSLMLRNAQRHQDNPEFRQDMLMTVGHAVERMKQLMMQLREGTTPVDAKHRVDLAELVQRVCAAKRAGGRAIELEILAPAATQAHPDRLERVVGHLVQNALDATEPSGRVWIHVFHQGENAVVEVGDTGHGMTTEFVRERLFKPFETTKQAGMGIGAYESQQYVRELGGRVVVESAPNAGTRVRVLLPSEAPNMEAKPPLVNAA